MCSSPLLEINCVLLVDFVGSLMQLRSVSDRTSHILFFNINLWGIHDAHPGEILYKVNFDFFYLITFSMIELWISSR